ncbi:hypothetical protein [Streptomyces litchfieldiae]|uniref:Integral membrane protein n=1 Tax=Streptomyces litchfieldiae TaxID=3075543 RepID=A0ABU2MNR3_9ACTN|nr:hypothetical protein [Streptomyces sp. DSM 44938]MDT0343265.1 hypothetical protein [Streptomyces sp. DSM 44938]
MGIEGEQLVFDYLSRVGDLAHGTSMSAAERASLVNKLRDEIGRQRAAAGGAESRASVRRILGKMGRPEDVVAAAAGNPARPAEPAPMPRPRPAERPVERPAERQAERPVAAPPPAGPEVPLAGPALTDDDDTFWPDGRIGRFVGGIEVPAMLRPPTGPSEAEADAEAGEEGEEEEAPVEAAPAKAPARRTRVLKSALSGKRVGGPVELAGVALLLAGTVVGSIYVLGLGWLLAYWSPRLSRRQAQWATFGMPSLVGGGYLLWLLGRAGGYWGATLEEGDAEAAFADHWPWLVRGAALASAAFLLYRARRPRPPAGE